MKIDNWLYLLSIIVSVISIFISNKLGQRRALLEIRNQQMLERYQKFYIPFMQILYLVPARQRSYYLIYTKHPKRMRELKTLLRNSINLQGKELPQVVSSFLNHEEETTQAITRAKQTPDDDFLVTAALAKFQLTDQSFDLIVTDTLQEATRLSKKLFLQPISEPLSQAYSTLNNRKNKYSTERLKELLFDTRP